MPDAPTSLTRVLELGQWNDGENPGASALNDQWEILDAAVMAHGDEFPAEYGLLQLFLRDDESIVYRNDGTEEAPSWTAILDIATAVATAVSAKADQSSLDAVQAELDALEASITAAEYIMADGSVAMEADLDMGNNEVTNAANGTQPDSLVTLAQLEAVESAVLGVLGSRISCSVSRTSSVTTGAGGDYIPWQVEDTDHGDMVDLGADATKIIIPQDGTYLFPFDVSTNAPVAAMGLWINGTMVALQTFDYLASLYGHAGANPNSIFGPFDLEAGDEVQFFINNCDGTGAITVGPIGRFCRAGAFLSASNAVGGGDLKSDGTVAMTADFDFGANKGVNAADATDPTDLTTLQQVEAIEDALQAQIDAITSGAALSGDQRRFVAGNQGFSTLDWEVVTGLTPMLFTLTDPKFVAIDAHGTALQDFQARANIQLGIQLQKTGDAVINIPGTQCLDVLGYYVNCTVVASEKRTLAAGEWTIRLIAKKISGFPYNPILSKTADVPAYIGYVLTG